MNTKDNPTVWVARSGIWIDEGRGPRLMTREIAMENCMSQFNESERDRIHQTPAFQKRRQREIRNQIIGWTVAIIMTIWAASACWEALR